jgi:co-chaperonin GroES (HSP10)
MNTKEMALELSKRIPFELADDRILVKPLKPVMIVKEVPIPIDPNAAKNLDEVEKKEVNIEKRKVPANIQKGVVLKVGPDYKESKLYEIGDIVMFPAYAGIKFELFKNSLLFRRYELLGKVIE